MYLRANIYETKMGQVIKKLYSVTVREVKMYNIEKRAERVISKDKPEPAPKYTSTIEELSQLNKENVSKEYLHEKNKQLNDYLRKVYVTSTRVEPSDMNTETSTRPLPQKVYSEDDLLFGYSEFEEGSIPKGQLSLKQALQIIADHRKDPKLHSSSAIASNFKLPITVTDDILEHFKMFDMRINKPTKDNMTNYEKLQEKVNNMNLFNAPDVLKDLSPYSKKKSLFKKKNNNEDKIEKTTNDNDNLKKK